MKASGYLRTEHGEFVGRNVATVIRREYGRRARFRHSADPNDPNPGRVVEPVTWNPGTWRVLAVVREFSGPLGAA